MNTNRKSKIRNLLCSIIAIFAFIFTNIFLLSTKATNVYADLSNSNKIEINNENFTKDSGNIFPIKSVTGFTAYSNNEEASNSNPNCGVIDLLDDDYATRFSIAQENRLGIDNRVLMLSSESQDINFGYRTKEAIKMNANSNYMVTVDVYTEQNAEIANISLYNNNEVFTSLSKVSSYCTWTTYHLFVKTAEEAVELKLGLNIVGQGSVLFDNISCYELNNKELQDKIEKQTTSHIEYAYKNEVNNELTVANYTANDNQLYTGSKYISLPTTNFIDGKNDEEYTEISTVNDSDGTNSSAIKINNKQKTFVEYTTADAIINAKQGLVYKVSVTAKTKSLSGKASLRLVDTSITEELTSEEKEKNTISITSNTSSSVNNNYQNFVFYIKSSPKKDTNYKLVISLGEEENLTSGELYISQINVTKIKTSNIKSDSNCKTIDLVDKYALSGNSLYVNNGEFDAYSIEDAEKPFPAKASNWTETTGTGIQTYGVVNTLKANFDKLTNKLIYPYVDETNENILMMYNQNADSLIYTSESKSLTANGYHKFTIDVQSQAESIKISLMAKKEGNEFEIASKSILTGAKTWTTLTFYIKTGSQPIDAYLKASLISSNEACAFIDNVTFDYPSAHEKGYNEATNSDFTAKVDLTDLLSNKLFTAEANENANYEIIDLENADFNTLVGSENVENFEKFTFENKKVIKLQNRNDTDFHASSNLAYKMSSGKKYKLSIDVFSVGLRTEVEDADFDKMGFGIKLSGFEKSMSAKQTNGLWKTYTFFINPENDVTSYLELHLGSEDLAISGTVYFGNIQFVELEEDEDFENLKTMENTLVLKEVEKSKEEDNKKDETTNEEKSEIDKQTLLYLIPSIVFALAIVITIVGVFSRKIKWKKRSKKSKNAYDRNKTVNKQYYERKATMLREQKLRELNKQVEDLHKERLSYEEEYKHNISKLREMKIKRASKIEITKLEHEMKKAQKLSASIGMSVSKLEREIEYMKTDLYYNSLVKKLASQGVEETEKAE